MSLRLLRKALTYALGDTHASSSLPAHFWQRLRWPSRGLAVAALPTATVAASGRVAHVTASGPSAKFIANARTALVTYLKHTHPGIMFVHPKTAHAAVTNGTTKTGSCNWSGYAKTSATAQAYTSVSAKWTPEDHVPQGRPAHPTWVGIDGSSNGTVEQDGTTGWCFRGHATYFTWYEMFPAGSSTVGKSLKPGDKITASVNRSGTVVQAGGQGHHSLGSQLHKTKTCALAPAPTRASSGSRSGPRSRPPASSRWPTSAAGRPPRWPARVAAAPTRSP